MSNICFSGIQPTGCMTLGNYLGAIKGWLDVQKEMKCFFSIVDLHAITTKFTPEKLKENIFYTVAFYIAAGVNYKKNTIFLQSQISEHSELMWILSCFTQLGWLNRMTQFKEKSLKQNVSLGLYSYPVLMAADILLYDADIVPVGEDQKQHVELVRNIVENLIRFGIDKKLLTQPKALINNNLKRIMSLKDVKHKMSKSDANDMSRINMHDDAQTIRNKIQKAKTDSILGINYDKTNRPEISNLIDIYSGVTGIENKKIVSDFANSSHSSFKKALEIAIIEKIIPIKKEVDKLLKDKELLLKILEDGATKAKIVARNKLNSIKNSIGII